MCHKMFQRFVLLLTATCFEIGAFPSPTGSYHGENLRAVIFLHPNSTVNSTRQNESLIEIFVEESKTSDGDVHRIYLRQDEGEGIELPSILGGGGGAELFTQLGQLFNAIFNGGLRAAVEQTGVFKNGFNFGGLFGRTTTTTTTTTVAPTVQKVKNPVRRKPAVRTTVPPAIEEEELIEIQVPVTSAAKPQIRTTVKRRVIQKTTLPPDSFEEY